jgi:hypothetical protein
MAIEEQTMSNNLDQPSGNPLGKYFRTPAIQLRLPSGGRYWPPGTLDMPQTGELPVYPMTARDEMIFNNPDALRNAWSMPSIDLDAVLVAIRIASYGETMDFTSTCGSCGEENTFGTDLRPILDSVQQSPAYDQEYAYQGLTFKFKPQDYSVVNMTNIETFESQRLFSVVNNSEMPDEEKLERVNAVFKKMTEYTVGVISGAIETIITPDGVEVANKHHIDEFLKNADRKTFKWIQDTITELGAQTGLNPIQIACPECEHSYSVPLTFDNANFFESSS